VDKRTSPKTFLPKSIGAWSNASPALVLWFLLGRDGECGAAANDSLFGHNEGTSSIDRSPQ